MVAVVVSVGALPPPPPPPPPLLLPLVLALALERFFSGVGVGFGVGDFSFCFSSWEEGWADGVGGFSLEEKQPILRGGSGFRWGVVYVDGDSDLDVWCVKEGRERERQQSGAEVKVERYRCG